MYIVYAREAAFLTRSTCLCRVELLQDILRITPEAKGRLLVDLINEPDGYDLTWDVSPAESTKSLSWTPA